MNNYKKNLLLIVLILVPMAFTFGQIKEEIPIPISVEEMIQIPVQKNISFGLNWFDKDKFSMSHSYSMSVGSFGKDAYSQGMYLNHMNYAASEKLNIKAVLGFTHDPFKLGNQGNVPNSGFDLSNMAYGAELAYKPTENSIFKFSFEKIPMNYRYGSGYNPYYYSPYSMSYYRRPSLFNNNSFNNY